MELLKRVGMADKALNYPDELSGGQKQRVAIEELVQQVLLPEFAKQGIRPDIHISAEYSMKDDSTEIDVRFGGERFDFRETDNQLSLSMIENTAEKMEYSFSEGEEKANYVKIVVKK